jgi:transcription elongation GreA/GreB family factor
VESTASRHAANLSARLADLRAEREVVLADLPAPSCGDEADRAINVDAYAHLATLDERITAIEEELAHPADRPADGVVAVGSVVGLDFGDGPEMFLVGSADHGDPELSVVTPASPLGQALLGVEAGARISYQARPGNSIDVTVTSVN